MASRRDTLVAVRGRRNRFDLVTVDAADGRRHGVAGGGSWGAPHWTADGAVVATHEDAGTAPRLCLVTPGTARGAARAGPARRPRGAARTAG